MNLTEKQTSSELIFDGKVVHLYRDTVELPDGSSSVREIVKHIGAVCVIPLTDDGDVILERQYRYAVGQILTEIPAGKLDAPDEDFAEAALRELREETGAVPRELIDLGDYYGSPAIMGERIRMFLARGLSFRETDLDEGEFLEVFRMPLSDAVRAVMNGEIPDGKTQCAILRAARLTGVGA
ncbi:MAG: NUDIX hydrolase [Ruminococcaceae bacterium]|jgi:ADP-ribose pyrophosphatase|nr:NUDIX hydrolase [Oscillospiraceae bacterium]